MKLYIGNLPYSTDDAALKALFEQFGTVVSASVITDRATGRSKGFGFVEFENAEDAKKAMAEMNESEVEGRTIKVDEARPRQ
ncbi:RNA-binding protein [candidate division WWE3 bacterium]|nr:RNA-binding protein [candidate division WWE3 bacterium]